MMIPSRHGGSSSSAWLHFVVVVIVISIVTTVPMALARPLVRNIQSTHEFDRLLRKHGEETGLPVIVDFYSDSCGPCRMMAPIFQKVAKQYLDRAVFVKIDTNAQYELSSRYQVRSLPTFSYFLGGSKVHQSVGGIGEGGLTNDVNSLVRQAEAENVILSLSALTEYYQSVDDSKPASDIASVHQKCVDMTKSKAVQECVGAPANQLARKLKKKYKSAPKLTPRFTEEDRKPKNTAGSDSGGGDSSNKRSSSSSAKNSKNNNNNNEPNLHLASKEQLQQELERRLDEERDAQVEQEDELEQEADADYHSWSPSGYPEKLVVIGGGPAGWSAAIYGARAGLSPLVICPSMGGQLQGKGVEVENYPGVMTVDAVTKKHQLTTGPALVASMRHQALHFGATVEDDVVIRVSKKNNHDNDSHGPIVVTTNSTGDIEAHTVIVATGAEANWLQVPGEWELRGGGVSSCATCDGFLFANQHVIVVGGGDAAMEDALVLARTSSRVTLIHRRDAFRASKVLQDRVLNHPVITVRWNTTVQQVLGKDVEKENAGSSSSRNAGGDEEDEDEESVDLDEPVAQVVRGVKVKNVATGELEELDCNAVFVAIGHTPSTSFLEGVVDFDPVLPGGYVQTRPGSTATSMSGLFAAGDVADAVYRQAITSAGSGAAAALDAERYLSEHGLGNEQDDLEAELLAELLMGSSSSSSVTAASPTSNQEQGGYNVYDSIDKSQIARESVHRAEL